MKYWSLGLFLILVASLTFAEVLDNASYYLLPGEENAVVNIVPLNLTNVSTNYSLVYVKGEPALLVKGNNSEIVESKSEMKDILWQYYLKKYAPSDINEIANEMEAWAAAFNESRNNGDQFPGTEEEACRKSLGENLGEPSNPSMYSSIYEFYSRYICSNFGPDIGCTDYTDILPDVESFFTHSYDIDTQLSTIEESINYLKDGEDLAIMSLKFEDISDAVDKIKDDVDAIDSNKFRFPTNLADCPDCYGVCAELIVNETALNNLKNTADKWAKATEPLYEFRDVLDELYNSTETRIESRHNYELRTQYTSELNSTLKGWNSLKSRAIKVLDEINDNKLRKKVYSIEPLEDEIKDKIENNNFTYIEVKIKTLENTIYAISNATKNYETLLDKLDESKRHFEIMYLSLYNKISDPLERERIKAEHESLSKETSGKIDATRLVLFYNRYENITTELFNAASGEKRSLVNTFLGSLQTYFNSLYTITKPYLPKSLSLREQFLESTPIIYSLIVGTSMAAVVVWISVPMFYRKEKKAKRIKKSKRIFFFMIILIGAFTVFIFFTGASFFAFDKGLYGATIQDFSKAIKNSNSVLLIAKSDSSIVSCLEKVKDELKKDGKNVTLIESYDDTCKVNGKSQAAAACDRFNGEPVIMANFADKSEISGSYLGENILRVELPKYAYDECYIAEVFKYA